MRYQIRVMSALAATLLIGGCGGGGGGGGSSVAPSTGPFSLQIVDAPVDLASIEGVCIAFTAVTVHYADGQEVRQEYEPATSEVTSGTHCADTWNGIPPVPPVKLDALRGAVSVSLVEGLQIRTGTVTWIRLHFTDDSYIIDDAGPQPLGCPSCEATDNNQGRGLKLNRSFEMTSAGLSLIADIDLGRSLRYTDARGYFLRPTVRVEPNDMQGAIAGYVATDLILDLGGEPFVGGDPDTGCAVYVFPDDGSPLQDVHDFGTNVIATAPVSFKGEPEPNVYGYDVGVLPVEDDGSPKSYRLALTCDPDDPIEQDEDAGLPPVTFTPTPPKTTTVSAGQIAIVNFPLE